MSGRDDLFRVSFDNTGLAKLLDEYESHLQKHDTQIDELYSLLRGIPTKDDFDQLRNELKDSIAKELNAIRSDLEGKMEEIKKDLDAKVQEMRNDVDKAIAETKNTKDDKSNDIAGEVDKLTNMINGCEAKIEENRGFIQTIASAHAGLNNNDAELDSSLKSTLDNATEKVNQDFSRIFDALKQLKLDADKDREDREREKEILERELKARDGENGKNASAADGKDGHERNGDDGESGKDGDGKSDEHVSDHHIDHDYDIGHGDSGKDGKDGDDRDSKDGGLKECGQAQADNLFGPLNKTICESPWNREHIEASNCDLNEKDAASLEVGKEDLDYCIGHEYDAEDDHSLFS